MGSSRVARGHASTVCVGGGAHGWNVDYSVPAAAGLVSTPCTLVRGRNFWSGGTRWVQDTLLGPEGTAAGGGCFVGSALVVLGLLLVGVGRGWWGLIGAVGLPHQLLAVRGLSLRVGGGGGGCSWWAWSLFENCTVDASIFVFCG